MTSTDSTPNPTERNVVVCGVDGSDEAVHALAWAVDHAGAYGLDVEVVTTWSFPSVGIELPSTGRVLHAGALAIARHAVELVVADRQAAGLPVPQIEIEAYLAHPADRLIAMGQNASLLVVGRGRRSILGSTSRSVVQHAPCPVVVIPAPGDHPTSASLTQRLGAEHPKIAQTIDTVSRHLSAMGI